MDVMQRAADLSQPNTAVDVAHQASARRLLGITLIGFIVIYVLVFFAQKQMLLAGASDFSFLYAAGHIVDSGQGANVYDYSTQRQAQTQFIEQVSFRKGPLLYNHAPFELLIYAPLAFFPYRYAVVLWYALNVAGLFAVPLLLRRSLFLLQTEFPYALLVPAFFFPATFAVIQGQDSIVLLILFTLVFVSLSAKREVRAGGVLALAMFKPHLVLPLLLVMTVKRRWGFVLAFISTCFALVGVSILLVGWRATLYFPAFLVHFNRLPADVAAAYPDKMPNFRGLTYNLLGSHLSLQTSQLLAATVSVLSIGFLLLFLWRRPALSNIDFAMIVTVSLLASYHVNIHDLALLELPFYIVADFISSKGLTRERAAIVIGVLALFVTPHLGISALAIALALLVFAGGLFQESYRDTASRAELSTT